MGTTALVAELFVGGIMTLAWMFLLAATALGPTRFAPLLEVPPTLAAGLVLVAAYAVGVVFDHVWDHLLDVSGFHIWARRGMKADVPEWEQKRRLVFGKDFKTAAEFVNYHWSRMRVARASFFNFILIAISGLTLLAVRYGGVGTAEFALAAGTSVLLCAASTLALRNLGRNYDRVLDIVNVEEAAVHTPPDAGVGTKAGPEPSGSEPKEVRIQ